MTTTAALDRVSEVLPGASVLGRPIARRRLAAAALALTASAAIWFGATTLSVHGRFALIVFVLAGIGWTLTRINDTTIALVATIALVLPGIVTEKQLFATFGNELIWLLVAAFIISAVLRETSLTTRLALSVLRIAGSVRQLFHVLMLVIVATALVIPSTSGRAAMLLPVFLALSDTIKDKRLLRALALLFPTVILLSACGSLIGAGAHLIAVSFIVHAGGEGIDYLHWLVLGMPMAILSSVVATEVILHLFLTRDERRVAPAIPNSEPRPSDQRQHYVAGVLVVTVVLWATGPLHGVTAAIVALASAIALTIPSLSGVSLKTAVKAVEWELILFLAATLLMGRALVESGAAEWLAQRLLAIVYEDGMRDAISIVIFLSIVSTLAHLVITSRSARATVLIPALALPLATLGLNPAAAVFLCVVGTGFCQTLPASAKAVALFGGLDRDTYEAKDLLLLSGILMPMMVVLLAIFSLLIWPALGLPLAR